MDKKEKKQRTMKGTVMKTADKTVIVEVSRYEKHPRVGKYLTIRKKYKVHDPENIAKVGEAVHIAEVPPVSKDKHFVVVTS
jgi:small subunit ribosomal protein S17